MAQNTPLRYPGGKGKLANYIKLVFRQNNLLDGHYVEPYAGGAGVAFAVLFEEFASHVHINDLSRPLYAFWYSVLNETDRLCQLIRDTDVTVEEWNRQKAIQRQQGPVPVLDLGFSTFFLNRTNRSGIISGGIIGGRKQEGDWKIDARYNKDDLIQRIKKIARYRGRISIYNQDAKVFIENVLPTLPDKTLIYLDPPYYEKGQALYDNFYEHSHHAEIATLVGQIQQRWMVSYDNVPSIGTLYSTYKQVVYNLSYSAAERRQGAEIIFFSNSLTPPNVANPARVSRRSVQQYRQLAFANIAP